LKENFFFVCVSSFLLAVPIALAMDNKIRGRKNDKKALRLKNKTNLREYSQNIN
jgi:hypothetical protein